MPADIILKVLYHIVFACLSYQHLKVFTLPLLSTSFTLTISEIPPLLTLTLPCS